MRNALRSFDTPKNWCCFFYYYNPEKNVLILRTYVFSKIEINKSIMRAFARMAPENQFKTSKIVYEYTIKSVMSHVFRLKSIHQFMIFLKNSTIPFIFLIKLSQPHQTLPNKQEDKIFISLQLLFYLRSRMQWLVCLVQCLLF